MSLLTGVSQLGIRNGDHGRKSELRANLGSCKELAFYHRRFEPRE